MPGSIPLRAHRSQHIFVRLVNTAAASTLLPTSLYGIGRHRTLTVLIAPAIRIDMELQRFLRLPEVLAIAGVCKSTLYEWIAQKKFPEQVPLSDHEVGAVGWLESEVAAWQRARLAERAKRRAQ